MRRTYRQKKGDISSSIEEYLETIYRLSQKDGVVRVKDISQELGVTYASTSETLRKMASLGLVEHERYGYAKLTNKGLEIAKKIEESEEALFFFFHKVLGIPEEIAVAEACRIEHEVGDETVERLVLWIEFLKSNQLCEKLRKQFLHFIDKKSKSQK